MRSIVLFGLVLAGMNLCFFEALDRLPLGSPSPSSSPARSRSRCSARAAGPTCSGRCSRPRGSSCFAPDIGDGLDAVGVAFAFARGVLLGALHPALGPGRPRARRARRPVVGDGHRRRGPDPRRDRRRRRRAARPGAARGRARRRAAQLGDPLRRPSCMALRRLRPSTFGVLLSLEPAVAALVGAIALDQALAGRELLAILLVVAASAGALRTAPGQRSGWPEARSRGTRAPGRAGTSGRLGLARASARRARRWSRACCSRRAGGGSGRRARRRSPSSSS